MNARHLKTISEEYSIPFEKARENLRKVFEEYGVTKHMQEDWLDTGDFYFGLLGDDGQLDERGKEIMESWKDSFGDFYKEMDFVMYMVD